MRWVIFVLGMVVAACQPSGHPEAEVFGMPDGWVVGLDGAGALEWQRARGSAAGADEFHAGVERLDGSVVVSGGHQMMGGWWLLAYPPDFGEPIERSWDRRSGPIVDDLVRLTDGTVVAAGSVPIIGGSYTDRAAWIAVVGEDGRFETEWRDDAGVSRFHAAVATADGGLVAVGDVGPPDLRTPVAVAFDAWLRPLWRRAIPDDGSLFAVAQLAGGELAVLGRHAGVARLGDRYLRLDAATGEVRLDGALPGGARWVGIAAASDGGLHAAAIGPLLARIDPESGAVLRTTPLAPRTEPADLRELADGTVLLAGRRCDDGFCSRAWWTLVREDAVIAEHSTSDAEASRWLSRIVVRAGNSPVLLGQTHSRTTLSFGADDAPRAAN